MSVTGSSVGRVSVGRERGTPSHPHTITPSQPHTHTLTASHTYGLARLGLEAATSLLLVQLVGEATTIEPDLKGAAQTHAAGGHGRDLNADLLDDLQREGGREDRG